MIGKKLSPILEEIEYAILEFESNVGNKPNYSINGFRAAIHIFMSVLVDKMFELQNENQISQIDRENMAQKCGEDLRKLVKTYTGVDTFDLFKK